MSSSTELQTSIGPLVSVLVAAYNVEGSFEACAESVSAQTYRNLQIVVVDDGSTDGTPELCDRFAERDHRVRVVHQENGGLSAARNTGLSVSKGDYVIFVDSDDRMMPGQVERLLSLLISESADIAYCDWFVNDVAETNGKPSVNVMSREEFMPLILTDKITSHAWNKLFKRSLWDGIEFPLGQSVEDMAVMHLTFAHAERVVHTNEKLYLYYAGNPNNTSNRNRAKLSSSIDRAFALESRYELARREYPGCAAEVFDQLTSFYVAAYYKALLESDPRSGELLDWLRENGRAVTGSGIEWRRKFLAKIAGTPLEGLAARAVGERLGR